MHGRTLPFTTSANQRSRNCATVCRSTAIGSPFCCSARITFSAADDGSRVQCRICGRFWRSLDAHARQSYGLGADQYRERFGLARTVPLIAPRLAA